MIENKSLTITRHLQVPLTGPEKSEKSEELVQTLNDLERLEEHFTLLREQHKANVKARTGTIKGLSHDLGAGYVMRPVSCEQTIDLVMNRLITTRVDTGMVIEDRVLTVEEMQAQR